jgi:outer membrane lipase/esterase
VAGGGNNARDAFAAAAACGGNSLCLGGIIQSAALAFAGDIATILGELELAGAMNIVVWDVPNIGNAPAVESFGPQASALATLIAASMNAAEIATIGGRPGVKLFDLFGVMNKAVADPDAFGLTNVTDACA